MRRPSIAIQVLRTDRHGRTAVFKTGAINHSATSPLTQFYYTPAML